MIIRNFAFKREVNLEFTESKDDLLSIRCDKHRLKQILLNLINNEVKFNKKGGSVRLGSRLTEFNPDGSRQVCIYVKDNGIGISEDDIPKIFSPLE